MPLNVSEIYKIVSKIGLVLLLLFRAFAAVGSVEKDESVTGVISLLSSEMILEYDRFYSNLQLLKHSDSEWGIKGDYVEQRFESLMKSADGFLSWRAPSVTDKLVEAPSGDPRDYCSLAPYWWPNPKSPDGMPYIRRDGEIFPGARLDDNSDINRLLNMARAVNTLALAYAFSDNNSYAEKAEEILNKWFVQPETRMNPNLNYGQVVRGRDEGRCFGIIETVRLSQLPLAILTLEKAPSFGYETSIGVKQWFADYLCWLQNSELGKEEGSRSNNHGTWYDVQVVSYAAYIGDFDTVGRVLKSVPLDRVLSQITADGRQPHELARTKSLSYSLMNLKALLKLAHFAKLAGLDFAKTDSESGYRLRTAVEFLRPYCDDPDQWPHHQLKQVKSEKFMDLMFLSAELFQDRELQSFVRDRITPDALNLEQTIRYFPFLKDALPAR